MHELAATGFYFDQKRVQPCFAYIAHVEATLDQLQSGVAAARDSWEVEQLIGIRFARENHELIALLRDEHPHLKLASNHATSVVWFAALYQFGFYGMRDVLSMPAIKDVSPGR